MLVCVLLCRIRRLRERRAVGQPLGSFAPSNGMKHSKIQSADDSRRKPAKVRLDRIPSSTAYYLTPELHHFRAHWPFLRLSIRGHRDGHPPYDNAELRHAARGVVPRPAAVRGSRTVSHPLALERSDLDRAGILIAISGACVLAILLTFGHTLAPRFLLDLAPTL